ncbi:hypothetical protein JDV02_000607 [Purpureocillium takamizusanense]|uniref:Arylsulfotransferase n=1 Tax=Purpureocillium takamizusanense TaxID=2060973 RepID=A0A9Q8Q7N1_9HYPO|nr:uncharacterized protein JDV02_000607 [Purpureocillium takamizusanense]UNI13912.1 hypothetical protein JDV02_000607 [Purpureocillium takamizusanense]
MKAPLGRAVKAAAAAALCLVALSLPAAADFGIYYNIDHFSAYADSKGGFPSQTFRSSDIVAPVLQVNSWDRARASDGGARYLFLGGVYGAMRAGPMIFDSRDLSLVYADQQYDNAYTSSAFVVNGSRYLAFWEGMRSRGHANGYCLVFDEEYRLRHNVTAKGLRDGSLADMHEVVLTPQMSVIFSTYFNRPFDCSPVGGPEDGLLMDSGFQEVDAETNEVLFEWHASSHFDISESYAPYSEAYGVAQDSGYDFFHINSIEKTTDGNYLISARHLSVLTLIDGRTGKPIWILGGKRNQFQDLSDGSATNFGWQHDARFLGGNQTQITMFDNHGEVTGRCGGAVCHSRGLHLEIDAEAMTARVVREYFHPQGVNSGAMGGMQTLESGNVIIGWGYNPGFVEYTGDGNPVMDIQRGKIGVDPLADMFAYRVGKHPWRGKPTWPPSAAVEAPNRTTLNATVYVSWNGATDVSSWAVLSHDDATRINNPQNLIATSPRLGFETAIFLGANHSNRYVAAAALATDGSVMGSTYVMDMETGKPVMVASGITTVHPWSLAEALRPESYETAAVAMACVVIVLLGAALILNRCSRWLSARRRAVKGRVDRAAYTKLGMED